MPNAITSRLTQLNLNGKGKIHNFRRRLVPRFMADTSSQRWNCSTVSCRPPGSAGFLPPRHAGGCQTAGRDTLAGTAGEKPAAGPQRYRGALGFAAPPARPWLPRAAAAKRWKLRFPAGRSAKSCPFEGRRDTCTPQRTRGTSRRRGAAQGPGLLPIGP